MARSLELSGITTSFATRALNYKHPPCYAVPAWPIKEGAGGAAEVAAGIRRDREQLVAELVRRHHRSHRADRADRRVLGPPRSRS